MGDLEREQAKQLRKGEKTSPIDYKLRAQNLEKKVNELNKQLSTMKGRSAAKSGALSIYHSGQKVRKPRIQNIDKAPRSRREKNDPNKSGFFIEKVSRVGSTTNNNNSETVEVMEGYFTAQTLTKTMVRIKYRMNPKKILIVKKPHDENCLEALHEVMRYLNGFKIAVILEKAVKHEVDLEKYNVPDDVKLSYVAERDLSKYNVDLIICLGGDGTILWASGLFPKGMPPLISFELGSLGFLTPFTFEKHAKILGKIFKDTSEVTIRSRLQVTFVFKNEESKKENNNKDTLTDCCLNEVVAKHPSKMVSLDLYSGQDKLTRVHADGLIVATPTGSTAYSVACGGSMMHPAIPAMMVTPIAPHTLSFRPIVVADSTTLRLVVPEGARTDAHVSLDGRNQVCLRTGDEIKITVSDYPMAAFTKKGESSDWYETIVSKFLWNVRSDQKPIPSS